MAESKWKDIADCYINEEDHCICLDAYLTDDVWEEGRVIAYIDTRTGTVFYCDPAARWDEWAQEIIDFDVKKVKKELAEKKASVMPAILCLWHELEDVPMDPVTEELESPFLSFPAGTHREEIWKWFENAFSISVGDDLMGK